MQSSWLDLEIHRLGRGEGVPASVCGAWERVSLEMVVGWTEGLDGLPRGQDPGLGVTSADRMLQLHYQLVIAMNKNLYRIQF